MSTLGCPPDAPPPFTPVQGGSADAGSLHQRRTGHDVCLTHTPPFRPPPLPLRSASRSLQPERGSIPMGPEHTAISGHPGFSGQVYYPEEHLRVMGKMYQDETISHNRTKEAHANEFTLRMKAESRLSTENHRAAETYQALQMCREHANRLQNQNQHLSQEVQDLRRKLHSLTVENQKAKLELHHHSTIQNQTQVLHTKLHRQHTTNGSMKSIKVESPVDVEPPGKRRRIDDVQDKGRQSSVMSI
ncbi:MAG: hypothetical protein M1823_004247 [Watsoniomyces obsoletus]|nr:MAG: hypothetical protein M1823_004247 [Watsoniomyces obsoletus]